MTVVRSRTVERWLDRVGGAQMDPVLGRVLVELQEHIGIIDDLGDRLGIQGAVIDLERFDRDLGLVDVLGIVDVLDRSQSTGML